MRVSVHDRKKHRGFPVVLELNDGEHFLTWGAAEKLHGLLAGLLAKRPAEPAEPAPVAEEKGEVER